MKRSLFIIIAIVFLGELIFFSSCDKENVPDQAQETLFSVPEAYPGIVGEIVEFIINGDTIICEKIHDEYVFQGDIILTEYQLFHNDTLKGAGLPFFAKRWPNNTVYYEIVDTMPDPSRITDAIEHIQEKTNVSFLKRTDQNQPNYINFIPTSLPYSASSNLGMSGEEQIIKISNEAVTGGVIHEIGHALGLIHEHNRRTRDTYIEIKKDNIKAGHLSQFNKESFYWYSTSYFDTSSIMLYPSFNTLAIDITKPTHTWIYGGGQERNIKGQREKLSEGDIEVINMIYDESYSIVYPAVISMTPIIISESEAIVGGKVTDDGGSKVTECGVFWGTSENPELYGTRLAIDIGLGSFSTHISGLVENKTYFLKAYAINSKGMAFGDQVSFTTLSTFFVGQNYGGGIIFYIDGTGEHGLITAASDQSTGILWYNGSYVLTGATATLIGTGMSNTQKIVTALGLGNYAAIICDQLVLENYDDWFLPSKNELDVLFDLGGTGSLGSNISYWASTESGGSGWGSGAWNQNKYFGGYAGMNVTCRVRAIRAF